MRAEDYGAETYRHMNTAAPTSVGGIPVASLYRPWTGPVIEGFDLLGYDPSRAKREECAIPPPPVPKTADPIYGVPVDEQTRADGEELLQRFFPGKYSSTAHVPQSILKECVTFSRVLDEIKRRGEGPPRDFKGVNIYDLHRYLRQAHLAETKRIHASQKMDKEVVESIRSAEPATTSSLLETMIHATSAALLARGSAPQPTSVQEKVEALCAGLESLAPRMKDIERHLDRLLAEREADRRTIVELRAELEFERSKKGEATYGVPLDGQAGGKEPSNVERLVAAVRADMAASRHREEALITEIEQSMAPIKVEIARMQAKKEVPSTTDAPSTPPST